MSIPASAIVKVNPRLITAGGQALELNGLALTKNDFIPTTQRMLQFTSAPDVADYFGNDSVEANYAAAYFLGYDNSFKKPPVLYFGRYIDADTPPWLRGGKVAAAVNEFKQMIAGTITLAMGGETKTIIDLDFSGATSYSAAAAILQNAIRAAGTTPLWREATVVYTSVFRAFILTAGEGGQGTNLGYADGDVAALMGLTEDAAGVLSAGADAQSPADNMEAMLDYSQNWVSFTTLFAADKAMGTALAKWSNMYGVRHLYICWSLDPGLTVQFNDNTIAAELLDLNVIGSTGVYGDELLAAFLSGTVASIDYSQEQGAISTAFKSQSGQVVTVRDEATANALLAKKFNFYGDYATANDHFRFFYPGACFGRYLYIDTYVNAVWLNNALQLAIMSLFTSVARIPYTERGYALVRAALQDPINQALRAGVIDPGVPLSEAQAAQVNNEAGLNVAPTIEKDGYYVQVKDPTAQVRAQRGTPVVNLWYAYGGSIHKLEMASTAII